MVYGFALDPELVATWGNKADFRYFYDKFGLGQPRLMVEFPKLKNWRRQVLHAASGLDGFEKQRITALIGILMERTIARVPYSEYDGTRCWLENAESEHAAKPFHAILAKENPRRHAAILCSGNLENPAETRWQVARDGCPARKAAEMASAVNGLLRNSTEIIFVDPHFGPENARHRRPLEAFLAALVTGRGGPINEVTVLTSNKAPTAFFSSECAARLPRITPAGLTVNLFQLAEKPGGEKLHNRYILSDIGGVKFQVGLDDGDDGQTDDVGLMDRKQYELRWSQYSGSATAFTVVAGTTVSGIKRIV